MVRAKIIDIWRKSVHDLGGEKGLERGIFAECSKNLVRFLPAFAETTHPREGTETNFMIATQSGSIRNNSSPRGDGNNQTSSRLLFLLLQKQLIPARGRKLLSNNGEPVLHETTHPREGTETELQDQDSIIHARNNSSPRGDGNMICMYSGCGKGPNVQFITGFRIVRKRIKRWIKRRGKNA